MPPARRRLGACSLGSLQLLGDANVPNKIMTEFAYRTDEHANGAQAEDGQDDPDAPLEVRFDEFMDGVNSRGRGAKIRQRKTTAEQAASVLLLTVQKGYVELVAKADDPQAIDVIRILPKAKRMLTTFLPKLRGYGDIPYDYQYRGAIALAKRHFFPNGKAPTKKELMAYLLQSYQERRELRLKSQTPPRQTQALGVQTSMASVDGQRATTAASGCSDDAANVPDPVNEMEPPDNDVPVDIEPTPMVSETETDPFHGYHDTAFEHQAEPARPVTATPVAQRSFNPYMTPVSNPRHADRTTDTPLDASPSPATHSNVDTLVNEEDLELDECAKELLQTTATYRGTLEYWYNAFITACRKITLLEGEKEKMEKKFDAAKRKLDETELRLRDANADRLSLRQTIDKFGGFLKSIGGQCQMMENEIGAHDAEIEI